MTYEPKPGDVALIESGCWANRHRAMREPHGWIYYTEHQGREYVSDEVATVVRPLLVVDPEDDAQVERLLASYYSEPGETVRLSSLHKMQAALRELANPQPPKPDEPLGLGAVVEDADGERWVRLVRDDSTPDDWKRSGYSGRGVDELWTRYADIPAVKVLSEGVA